MAPTSATCSHETLQLDVSPHAATARFERPPLAKRKAATTASGRATGDRSGAEEFHQTEHFFPGPLVLPGDALALDPKEPPQSLRSWIVEKARNPVTRRRKTIYVAPVPQVAPEFFATVSTWAVPSAPELPSEDGCRPPRTEQVRGYLEAFYHPLPVQVLPDAVRFVPWTAEARNSKQQPRHVGLQIGSSVTRVTTRPCPGGAYPRQLSLNDMLDAAIAALPEDAYAVVLLTNHDLYEDEDDDFCCGRAYGGSRVAVVSSARYHPLLDGLAGVEQEHTWPFSHCGAYVRRLCGDAARDGGDGRGSSGPVPKRQRVAHSHRAGKAPAAGGGASTSAGPMKAVIQAAAAALAAGGKPMRDPTALWLSRVVRTVAHEVGHCFCLAHCTYYACVMQSTSSIAEDVRQPPYLCPVCLAKLGRAVADVEKGAADGARFVSDRYAALARFCSEWQHEPMFAAYRCWLERRIEAVEASRPPLE